jgi:hypothetical protein
MKCTILSIMKRRVKYDVRYFVLYMTWFDDEGCTESER